MKMITIMIPAYNEEESIPLLLKTLKEKLQDLRQYQFEILFINDGSTDQTLEVIKDEASLDKRIQYVDLSRNFGKETAMLAGFDYAKGDAVVIMDADLQHPPEMIFDMIHYWEEGFDDVYTVRLNKNDSAIRKFFSSLYYKILQNVSDEEVYPSAGDFRLLDRKCVEALKQMRESERYTKGMYGWIGFKKKRLEYEEQDRVAGETKWSYRHLFNLAINGILSYSTVPLRLSTYLGLIMSFLAFIYLVYEVSKTLIHGSAVSGYPTIIASVLLLGGIQLISTGIIGEYLSKVFIETKDRPVYLVKESSRDLPRKDS